MIGSEIWTRKFSRDTTHFAKPTKPTATSSAVNQQQLYGEPQPTTPTHTTTTPVTIPTPTPTAGTLVLPQSASHVILCQITTITETVTLLTVTIYLTSWMWWIMADIVAAMNEHLPSEFSLNHHPSSANNSVTDEDLEPIPPGGRPKKILFSSAYPVFWVYFS